MSLNQTIKNLFRCNMEAFEALQMRIINLKQNGSVIFLKNDNKYQVAVNKNSFDLVNDLRNSLYI